MGDTDYCESECFASMEAAIVKRLAENKERGALGSEGHDHDVEHKVEYRATYDRTSGWPSALADGHQSRQGRRRKNESVSGSVRLTTHDDEHYDRRYEMRRYNINGPNEGRDRGVDGR